MENHSYIATANRACSLLYSYIKEHADRIWLLPVNVCPDVPLTFCLAKVPFKFVDIDPETLCIDLNAVEKILLQSPSKSVGLLYVRTYGVLNDTSEDFVRLKSIYKGIVIIDDRCLCVPERMPHFWNADMLLYSTGHCKQIDLNGGGLAFYKDKHKYIIDQNLLYDSTDEEALYKEAYRLNTPLANIPVGWLKMDTYNNPDEYFSLIEKKVHDRIKQRSIINEVYKQNFPPSIQLKKEFQNWRFNIFVDAEIKDKILAELVNNNLFASSHYHSVNRLFDNKKYPVSDSVFKKVINLFNDRYYTPEKAEATCNIINKIISKI